jgi:hypothetical protein
MLGQVIGEGKVIRKRLERCVDEAWWIESCLLLFFDFGGHLETFKRLIPAHFESLKVLNDSIGLLSLDFQSPKLVGRFSSSFYPEIFNGLD